MNMENPKEFIKQLLELFSRDADHTVNIQKSILFRHFSKKHLEMKLKFFHIQSHFKTT